MENIIYAQYDICIMKFIIIAAYGSFNEFKSSQKMLSTGFLYVCEASPPNIKYSSGHIGLNVCLDF